MATTPKMTPTAIAARILVSAANAGQAADVENLLAAAAGVLSGFEDRRNAKALRIARATLRAYRSIVRSQGLRAGLLSDQVAEVEALLDGQGWNLR